MYTNYKFKFKKMAIDKMLKANPTPGRNKDAIDNTLVKYGDINTAIGQANTDIEALQDETKENASSISENTETIDDLAPKENPVFTGAEMFINLLPTEDPGEANQLWIDDGALMISLGEPPP